MEAKLLKEDINYLCLNDEIVNKLKANNINKVEDLCTKTKADLRQFDLEHSQIINIEIKLQLNGLNIKGKRY